MDCIVHGVTKSQTRLSSFRFHIDTDFFSKELAYMIVESGWASLMSTGRKIGWKFISRSKNAAEKQNCFFIVVGCRLGGRTESDTTEVT